MNGLNPFEYLKDVLERIVSGDVKAHQLDRLLPWNWKAERTGRTTAQAAWSNPCSGNHPNSLARDDPPRNVLGR